MRYGRGIDKETCRRFVLMYVNDYTRPWVRRAAPPWSGSSPWPISGASSRPSRPIVMPDLSRREPAEPRLDRRARRRS